ncbi:D-2-hydroxyacid dehydrogenase [Halorubrum lacusprofundi]|jgi:phosphoglycerate dehydrogenase-like enzyme|uniref:D-isomer specific 2-hydroxyacid dehydrogenase NAD-binding n=1 Tax=Halorubrum lacusprofundi (strain ATCC 49239 / DSM 5036 / JCM 8891 / ACAM 34) TaxID=416348 RepID=B9LP47_HALLT|nr:D-2-hydroxyacid dehydrogenase [Halorubrum lacusprofundi]ACM57135.1 D-isomer specific 2-hydroxyacid dehydrogenase NAD-binding [Halorubrum lacusprofundi ATCC 49239]MCG1007341.1 D-2-hydroxyacid dehydrogenase [Halorubrum lacusprofundi]
MSDPDIVVLRQTIHGSGGAELAAAIRERLSDRSVALARTPAEERELLETARIAVGLDIDEGQLAAAENLELFACVFAGTGHLPRDALADHGVALTNASGVHGPNIAEHVLGSMITHARQWARAHRQQERREWRSYETTEMYGSTVAVVGLGAIGSAIVDRLEPFDVDTVGVRYSPEKGGPTDEVYGFDAFHDAIADAEYVVLACPLTETTRGLVDAEALRTMRADAILINIARGPIVDTDALVSELRNNRIRGAALDVTDPEPLPEDHPLWGLGNVTITPHNAGHTPHYYERVADILAENVGRLDDGDDLKNRVL